MQQGSRLVHHEGRYSCFCFQVGGLCPEPGCFSGAEYLSFVAAFMDSRRPLLVATASFSLTGHQEWGFYPQQLLKNDSFSRMTALFQKVKDRGQCVAGHTHSIVCTT